jgi:hypothetical protein
MVEDHDGAWNLAELAQKRGDAKERTLRQLLHLAAGSGDWDVVDELASDIEALGVVDASSLGPVAFFLSVQGRFEEAAKIYARIGPLPESPSVPAFGAALLGATQDLPALLRTYRAMGRTDEADRLAAQYLASLRQNRPEPGGFGAHQALDQAALAANEGHQDEAVTALQSVFEHSHLIVPFDPQPPWFRSLEGHAGYSQLLAERQRRIDQARAEMRALETQHPESRLFESIRAARS